MAYQCSVKEEVPNLWGFFVFFSAFVVVVVCLFVYFLCMFLVYLQAILVSWQSTFLFSSYILGA